MTQTKSCRGQRGFTLVELLVVIAIIAILAAILFPMMTAAKVRATQQKCLGNLKQLALAMIAYTDDSGGRLPNARVCVAKPSWEGADTVCGKVYPQNGQIFRYVRNHAIYQCPSDLKRPAKQIADQNYAKVYPLSYSMNYDLSWRVVAALPKLKSMLLLIHESRDTINDGDFNWMSEFDIPSAVHYDGTTVVYVDGHATWQSNKQLIKAKRNGEWEPDPR